MVKSSKKRQPAAAKVSRKSSARRDRVSPVMTSASQSILMGHNKPPPGPLPGEPSAAAPITAATLTIEQVAKRLRIGRNQAYDAAHKGELPVIRIGRRLLIPAAALSRMLGEIA